MQSTATTVYKMSHQNTPNGNLQTLSLSTNLHLGTSLQSPLHNCVPKKLTLKMSNSTERAQMPANSAVRNTAGKGSKQATDGNPGFLPEDRLHESAKNIMTRYCPSWQKKLGVRDKSGFTRLGEKRIDIHSRLGPKVASRTKHASDRRHVSSEMSAGVQNHGRREARNPVHSDVAC
ncbi:hypothetical protein Tco_0839618, partial [Tanacetum coccineum]